MPVDSRRPKHTSVPTRPPKQKCDKKEPGATSAPPQTEIRVPSPRNARHFENTTQADQLQKSPTASDPPDPSRKRLQIAPCSPKSGRVIRETTSAISLQPIDELASQHKDSIDIARSLASRHQNVDPGAMPRPDSAQRADPTESIIDLLASIVKQYDRISLGRTQWEQDYSQWKTCRGHLQESLDDLIASTNALASESSRETCVPKMGIAHRSGNDSSPLQTFEKFRLLHRQYQADYEAFKDNEDVMLERLEHIRRAEYRHQELHKKLGAAIKSPNVMTGQFAEMFAAKLKIPDIASAESSISDIPELVRSYFDKASAVNYLQERLEEVTDDYVQGQASRKFKRDRLRELESSVSAVSEESSTKAASNSLEVSDETFESTFLKRHQDLQRDLGEAEEEAKQLRIQCEAKGLSPESYQHKRRSARRSSAFDSPPPSDDGYVSNPAIRRISAVDRLSPDHPQLRSSVHWWMRNIPSGASPEPRAQSGED